jgi:uncharacterized protein with HEPN domain
VKKRAEPYLLHAERALDQLEQYVHAIVEAFLEQPVLQDAILLQILQIGGEPLSASKSIFSWIQSRT